MVPTPTHTPGQRLTKLMASGSRAPLASCFGAQVPLQPLDRLMAESPTHLNGPYFSPLTPSFLRRFQLGSKPLAETGLRFRSDKPALEARETLPTWRVQVPGSSVDCASQRCSPSEAAPFLPDTPGTWCCRCAEGHHWTISVCGRWESLPSSVGFDVFESLLPV